MNKIFLLIFISLILFLTSCGKQEYTEKGINKIVQRTDSLLINLAGQKYDWASAKAYSTVRAFYTEPDIIFLNEKLKYRRGAEAFNLYYYKDGHIIHFIGKKIEYFPKKGKKTKQQMIKLWLILDYDGDLISYQKIVDGKILSLDDSELEEVLTHAEELYELVGDKEE
ncbi:MAG: hypothetical protein IH950_03545 [Bacteroidetes bacterium]|nr:hypothetical protein [Bacteroidota bacterium]